MPDREPPVNLEIEATLLGAAMLDPAAMLDVASRITPSDFFSGFHQAIAEAVWSVYERTGRCDPASVSHEADRLGLSARVGDVTSLGELVERAPHAANANYHAGIIRELSRKRQLIAIFGQGLAECYETTLTADDVLGSAEARTLGLSEDASANRTRPAAAFAKEAVARMVRRQEGEVMGVSTGIEALDDETDGLAPCTLTVLAARPGHGKTALALSIAQAAAIGGAVGTLFVSLEMGGIEIGERLVVSRSGVSGKKARLRGLTERDWRDLEFALEGIHASGKFWIDDTPSMHVSALSQASRRMKAKHDIGLLIVDYIQLIEPGRGEERSSRQEQVSKVSRRLKILSKELAIPVLALSQLNRESEKREDRRPRLSDLRESGAIEQDADVVLMLHRPEMVKEGDREGEADLAILKNRNGGVGTIPLKFEKHLMRFTGAELGPLPHDQRFDEDPF